jgi:hypothetical protein
MSARFRSTLAALAAALLCATSAVPAAAYSVDENADTPVVFDALIVRPFGFVSFVFGSSLFVASLPLVAVTRPQDIDEPWKALVVRPARFVWGDELGAH